MTIKTLNLVDMDCGNVTYEIQKFPDGQQNIRITGGIDISETIGANIYSRMNSFMDLELIICATASLKQIGVKNINLIVPYFLGARSDRKFGLGTNNYLKDVICPLINLQNYNNVWVLDPHSDCLEMGVNNLKKLPEPMTLQVYDILKDDSFIICPDAGATKRVNNVCSNIVAGGIDNEVIVCNKVREKGKIVKTNVPAEDLQGRDCIIIDDICSKGGTFIGIAKELKKKGAGDIYLVVSHYEGTAREQELKDAGITKVFTTNSISDETSDFVYKHKIIQTV